MFDFFEGIIDGIEDFIDDAVEFLDDLFNGDEVEDVFDNPDYLDAAAPAYNYYVPGASSEVVGSPDEYIDNWHMQESSSSCAVCSQEFIIEQLTGIDITEDELCDFAEEMGWFDPNGGTLTADVGNILEAVGINVERSEGNTFEDLENCLENGSEVIVAVDSGEIWYGMDEEVYFPGMDADHAIQVIGIDNSNPDCPMVIVNDSGVSNGAGAMIPADIFMSAWEDSGCFMVEAFV